MFCFTVNHLQLGPLSFYDQFNRLIVTKFRTKFTLLDITPPTRLRRVRIEENIAAVSASINDDHQLSIRRRSQQRAKFCERI